MTGHQPKIEKTCGTCGKGIASPFCSTPVNVCKDWTPPKLVQPTGGSSGTSPRDEIARLKRREDELLEANNRYLERARDAEAKLADADAATIAMEAKVVDLEQTIARAHAILDQAPGMESKGDLFGLADAVVRAWEELGGDAGPKQGG